MEDIAPLILYLFDVHADKRMERKIQGEFLKQSVNNDLVNGRIYKKVKPFVGDEDFNDEQNMEQLRGLGYID